jgi:hypothetical protein
MAASHEKGFHSAEPDLPLKSHSCCQFLAWCFFFFFYLCCCVLYLTHPQLYISNISKNLILSILMCHFRFLFVLYHCLACC